VVVIRSPTVVTADAVQQEFGIIQKAIPAPGYPGRSATEGLTLNITVPEGTKATDRLPVVAFLHGGAFVFGANYYPQYDGERLVSLSVAEGKPVIAITIKYVPMQILHIRNGRSLTAFIAIGLACMASWTAKYCATPASRRTVAFVTSG
jgi:hypothetical protein